MVIKQAVIAENGAGYADFFISILLIQRRVKWLV